ncbi:MAG TPA: anion permease [Thermoanaerobaculaceae bacterium]|nr:anion permease [Thermoanaerobaculaceae bacterium]
MKAWRAVVPVAVAVIVVLAPVPSGLPPHAWRYFALFAGVVVALMVEPLPGGAVGLIGVTVATLLSRWVLFGPAELARPGFKPAEAGLTWALSGFSNATVWLIFAAFMFALGYERTGLGRRVALLLVKTMGRRTLALGYAVTIADTILAPFTPSNTARSGGTIYPVIRNVPPLFDSRPNDPSARRIGSYLMWVAISATCVTSSLFLTGLAPNLLAAEIVRKTVGVELGWVQWFVAFAPVGAVLLLLVPLLTYWIFPPEVRRSDEVPEWAARELGQMGKVSPRELLLGGYVIVALALWIFGGAFVNATTVALVVVCLMLLTRVFTWDDVTANKPAWNTLAWFATLVALADGLARTGFVTWFANSLARRTAGLSPTVVMVALVVFFYLVHYLFASSTAHTTALLPIMLAVGGAVPGLPVAKFALLLCLSLGLLGILTPYGTGPSPVYYGSGYLPSGVFWRLGAIFGLIFLVVFLGIGVPWVLAR